MECNVCKTFITRKKDLKRHQESIKCQMKKIIIEKDINKNIQEEEKEKYNIQLQEIINLHKIEKEKLIIEHEKKLLIAIEDLKITKELYKTNQEFLNKVRMELAEANGQLIVLNKIVMSQEDIINGALKQERTVTNINNATQINIKQSIPDRPFFPLKKKHIERDNNFLQEFIITHGIEDGLRPFCERYYYTYPPNIIVDDESRQKLRVYTGKDWTYMTIKDVYNCIYKKSIIPILYPLYEERMEQMLYEKNNYRKQFLKNLPDKEYDERLHELERFIVERSRCHNQLIAIRSMTVKDFWKNVKPFFLNMKNNDENLVKADHFKLNENDIKEIK